jgi:secreted PhoX family phosphatase
MAPSATRRRFLYATGAAAVLGGAYPLMRALEADPPGTWRRGPFGPLRPDPDRILDLPEGFSYRVIQHAATPMDDGHRVPARPDGMACFALPGGELALMRNHENPAGLSMLGPFVGAPPREAWSADGMGGVTRVVLDPVTLERRSSNLVLAGTILNCSGGPSPFGWLSCEEAFAQRHGLVFACDPTAASIAAPRPIPGYGKLKHEAVCVDPATSIAYLTEDREDGCLYRFVPRAVDVPFEGELQALAVRGRPAFDTALAMRTGDRVEIEWIPVIDPAPADDVVRYHARRAGAAVVCRGEGIAFESASAEGDARASVVITASTGGPNHTGQIFRLLPEGDGGELVLLAQSERRSDFEMPDNVAIAPSGAVFFCEDGQDRNWLRGLDAEGRVFDFARNVASRSELAGVCFSPDGRAMFVNLQEDGLTLGITGPFEAASARV